MRRRTTGDFMTRDEKIVNAMEKDRIRDVLYWYARGIDRADTQLLRSVFHDEAHISMGIYDGDAQTFCGYARDFVHKIGQTQHNITNTLITINGDLAECESYCVAYHADFEDGGQLVDLVTGVRYVDRLECRADEWRILRRRVVFEWVQLIPMTAKWDGPFYSQYRPRGARDRTDTSYVEIALGLSPGRPVRPA
jgi:SnoaL-like domain